MKYVKTMLCTQAGTCLLPRMNCDVASSAQARLSKCPPYFLFVKLRTFLLVQKALITVS